LVGGGPSQIEKLRRAADSPRRRNLSGATVDDLRQTLQQRHRLRKRAPKNGCRDIGRPFPALCALFVGNFPAVNPVCMTASRRMLSAPQGRPEGPEISLPGPFPFGATETPLFGHLLTTPVAGRSCSNRWTRRGAPYCLRFAAAGLVGVDEVERLACASTLRTVLIGTAPRHVSTARLWQLGHS
jgi:hypothetical protein